MCSLSQVSIIFESSRPSRQSLYFNRGYGMLPLTCGPASGRSTCVPERQLRHLHGLRHLCPDAGAGRVGSAHVWPGLVAELRSLVCKSTTMPPAINWSQELANLRQEIADPLVPVHPDLPGLATRHTPPDDQDVHEDQHRIMRCWHANASGPRAKVEGQLAWETLLQWVPVMQDCLSLLSLPLSLQAGEIRLTQGNFGNQIVDFADRAMRLRCCNQREAWHMLTMPAVARAGTLSQLCTPVLRLSEHQALDLSWYQLAKPQIWLHGPPTRNATLPNSPLLHLGALLPVQLLFYLVRHLLDEPGRFPNLSVVGVTMMEHGPVLEVRVSASFPGSFLCPVQEAVGARLIQAFEQGRVMVHIPAFCPDQFTHPKAYTG
eukprot:s1929_g1.t1